MRSVAEIVGRFKRNWSEELSPHAIAGACRDAGMQWYESALNRVVTIQIFFVQILHGNTACEHLSHLTGLQRCILRFTHPFRSVGGLEPLDDLIARPQRLNPTRAGLASLAIGFPPTRVHMRAARHEIDNRALMDPQQTVHSTL